MKKKIERFILQKKIDSVMLMLFLILAVLGVTFSRYYDSMINSSDLKLAPWSITINDEKVSTSGKMNVLVNPVVTETTTNTNTYENKIVPGCKGYFDVKVDPTGTGVSVDYTIDFNPSNLLGGMKFTKYELLDENGVVTQTFDTFPLDAKLNGSMSLVDGKLLNEKDIVRYRIYWDYVDNDLLNVTAPTVDAQECIMINVILQQSV